GLCQGRSEEGPGRIHDEPDRVHAAGGRARPDRVRVRDLPPAHPRLLQGRPVPRSGVGEDRKSTRLNSSHVSISYAVFSLKNNTTTTSSRRTRLSTSKKQTTAWKRTTKRR